MRAVFVRRGTRDFPFVVSHLSFAASGYVRGNETWKMADDKRKMHLN
jgi:hypothetical protein